MIDLEQRIKEAAEKATPGEFEARYVSSGMPVQCVKFGVIALGSNGIEVYRVWNAENALFAALASPANILALLAEKDAEIERLKKQVTRWKIHARTFADSLIAIEVKVFGNSDPINDDSPEEWPAGLLSDKVLELKARAESAERERDEWKRVAGELIDPVRAYRSSIFDAWKIDGKLANHTPTSERAYVEYMDSLIAAYDALVKGE